MNARRAGLALALLTLVFSACGGGGGTESEEMHFRFPTRMAVAPDLSNPDAAYLFVLNYLGGTLSVVNVYNNDNVIVKREGNKEKSTDPVDAGDYPAALAVSEGGDRVFLCSAQGGPMHVVDVDLWTTRTLDLALGPCEMVRAGRSLVIADLPDRRLVDLDTETETLAREAPLSETPVGLALSAEGRAVFLTTREGNVWKIDLESLAPVAGPVTIPGAPGRIEAAPDGLTVYLVNSEPSLLHRLDAATLRQEDEPVELPGLARDLLVTPDGKWVYTSNSDGRVYVYDTARRRACGATASEPEFTDLGPISDPVMETPVARDCVAREEEWRVKYDQREREWVVTGQKSGEQAARAQMDRTYVSDNGSVQFLIRSGTRAPSDEDEFFFTTDPGIAPLRVGVLPDDLAVVPNYEKPDFFVVWVANTLSNNLNHISTEDHELIGVLR